MPSILDKYRGITADVTLRCILTCSICATASVGFGYDFTLWGSIIGAPHFNHVFGELEVPNPTGGFERKLSTQQTSVGTGLGTVGLVIGCMGASYFNETFGRKFTILVCVAGVGALGTVIQTLSAVPESYWMCVIGKLIVNASIGTAITVVPAYMSECAPPAARGGFVALYSVFQGFGALVAGIVIYTTVYNTTAMQYVLPFALQGVIPIFLVMTVPFIAPESPRWLACQGRLDEAAAVLDLLRPKYPNAHEKHMQEVTEMKASFDQQNGIKAQSSWLDLFRGRNLKRTMTILGAQCLQQAQGATFLTYYAVVTFISIGIQDVYLISLGITIYSVGLAFINVFLPDLIGRRALLLGGSSIMFACMLVIGAIGATHPTPTGALANLVIAAVFIFLLGFSVGWGSTIWLVNSELPARSVVDKSIAVGGAAQFATSVVITFVIPYMQNPGYGNLGTKIAFIFAGLCLVTCLFVYFLVPETAGRTNEEIDWMYEEGISPRRFKRYDTTLLVQRKRAEMGLDDPNEVALEPKGQDGVMYPSDVKKDSPEHLDYISRRTDA